MSPCLLAAFVASRKIKSVQEIGAAGQLRAIRPIRSRDNTSLRARNIVTK